MYYTFNCSQEGHWVFNLFNVILDKVFSTFQEEICYWKIKFQKPATYNFLQINQRLENILLWQGPVLVLNHFLKVSFVIVREGKIIYKFAYLITSMIVGNTNYPTLSIASNFESRLRSSQAMQILFPLFANIIRSTINVQRLLLIINSVYFTKVANYR